MATLTVGTLRAELEADTDDFEKALKGASKDIGRLEDSVDASQKAISKSFARAEDDAKGLAGAINKAGDATDASESKFMGTADVLDGLGSAFGLPTDKAVGLARAFGDLTGGFTQLAPLFSGIAAKLGIVTGATAAQTAATTGAAAAQTGLNAALLANPIAAVVAGLVALGAALVLAWKYSETFRDVVSGAFDFVKKIAGPVFDFIGKGLSFIGGLFGKGGDDAEGMSESHKMAAEASMEAWDTWKSDVASSLDSLINPLERARENSKVSLDEINRNLTDNVAFFQGWINNVNELTRRGFGELAGYLYSLGPTAEKAVGDAVRMTDSKLQLLQNNIIGKLDSAGVTGAQLLVNGIGGKDYAGLGVSIGQRVVGGLNSVFAKGTLGDKLLSGGGLLGTPSSPSIRRFHDGGIVPGPRGADVPAILQAGERVIPANQAGGGMGNDQPIVVQLVADGQVIQEILLAHQRRSGPLGFREN